LNRLSVTTSLRTPQPWYRVVRHSNAATLTLAMTPTNTRLVSGAGQRN
jgi:hypothetical protein